MKKIMFLGGSRFLIPAIKAAHDLGLYVITADYLPNNYAHRFSDEYVNVSIIDKEATLIEAQKRNIDGISSFACDPGVTTMAFVAEKMGLPCVGSYESVSILQHKGSFRRFLREHGFNTPLSQNYSSRTAGIFDADRFKFPVIVKPVDSAGSKGVTKCNGKEDLEDAIERALRFSHCGEYVIEEFLPQKGYSSDCDSYSIDGELVFASFSSQRFDIKSANPFTPSAYSWPATISAANQIYLKSELQRLISLLGLRTSIYNIETRETIEGIPYIMEMSPRAGGNRLSEMIKLVNGVDLISLHVSHCVGIPSGFQPESAHCSSVAEIILHSKKPGVFDEVHIDRTIDKNVIEKDLWVSPGDYVNAFRGANDAIGTIVLSFENQVEMDLVLRNIDKYISVVTR